MTMKEYILLGVLFLSRYFVLATTISLLLISILYAIGSVTSIQGVNLWCDSHSEYEVRSYNYIHGFEYGQENSCYYIDRKSLNFQRINNLDLDLFTAALDFNLLVINASSLFQFCIYVIISLFLLCMIVYHFYYIVYDSIFYKQNSNHRILKELSKVSQKYHNEHKEIGIGCNKVKKISKPQTKQSKLNFTSCCKFCKWLKSMYYTYIRPVFYIDSKYKLISMLVREMIEISIQLYGLFLYGGVNVFNVSSNILSQEPYVIKAASIIISLNCILTGILFVLYVLKHDIIHGKLFMSLIFVVDTIFEMIYCLFPLLYLTSGNSMFDLKSLGLLRQENFFILFQSLWALVLLARKCHVLLNDLNPTTIVHKYWKNIKNNNNYLPWININNNTQSVAITTLNSSETLYKTVINTATDTQSLEKFDLLHQNLQTFFANINGNPNIGKQNIVNNVTRVMSVNDRMNAQIQAKQELRSVKSTSVELTRASSVNSAGSVDFETPGTVDLMVMETEKNKKQTKQQCQRKLVIMSTGLGLILIGIAIWVSFLSFIVYEFGNKCINPNSDGTWLEIHGELNYFNTYCEKKVINIFNYEYPCNCRLLKLDYENNNNNNNSNVLSQIEFEQSFVRYTNLEGVSVLSSHFNRPNYNISKEMVQNLIHLKILSFNYITINYIHSAISNLQKLQIFAMKHNNGQFYMPFASLAQISSINAIHIENSIFMTNREISDEICRWHDMVYFYLSFSFDLEYIPLDCISQYWQNLLFFKVLSIVSLEYFDPKLWLLPDLYSFQADRCNFNQSVLNFQTFKGYSQSLETVSLFGNNKICSGSVDIDGISYEGFEYLDPSDASNYDYGNELLTFIKQFDPCLSVCDSSVASCDRSEWKDGICNQLCNVPECNYDGGDCNQLCNIFDSYDVNEDNPLQCNSSMLLNDKCDNQCNNTECAFDLYSCIDDTVANGTCLFESWQSSDININDSDSNTTSDGDITIWACYDQWTHDVWCDSLCNIEQCGFDNNECNSCKEESGCEFARIYIIDAVSKISEPFELIMMDDVCQYWDALQAAFENTQNFENCTMFFQFADTNKNGYIGFLEGIVAISEYLPGLDTAYQLQEKLKQIDCSPCLINQSLYYW